MHFLPEDLDDYVVAHSQQEPKLLQDLTRETWQKVLAPRMLSGHFQGRVLSMISKLIQPTSILEIGTYTGYSALCLAEGMSKDAVLHTIDINEELQNFQRKYFNASGYGDRIIQHVGDAMEIIPTLNTTFDLVFIDADKVNYPNYFELVMPLLKSGAVILSDNVLWTGKVIEPLNPKDKDTAALLTYNKLLNTDDRVESVLLPIRDGLTVTRVL
ncbi:MULTISPECIES: O-methyltransferase [Croceibacter]|jgi:predicted O-methyltransferase YrrM|uniref:O-methyltransferase family protein n=1 Tax=Croceibacter atlanticus (strain ATCC BAA-628 / JCM 21780 / CIP 108009 / IAM 15332 / KCTC 12090 / HTCC2559) TaxID=216432 RepID=A3U8L2_CROAH|nr:MULTISPECIES: O-methyltransferase [Croceibacter]EAP88579.1 O-methyltransferase family protein [Croceibacter atlanticus HTCC2559]MBG26568.1 O-methyltransferase [Croceibacter sp.]MBW4969291.1 O-methyltransferase [Croceibacter atlanticus]HAT69032.1 O-methyltransferase [Flavobacteriaceae bacterium]|tara:strand:+ start:4841 stop:5482 length:642 start_codon:yes stop_codon:yes gene_type:complete